MKPAIEISGLSKYFRISGAFLQSTRKRVVLDQISLSVSQGEIFALLGPNGAGKTTLLKILCTLILPDAGQIRVNGYDLKQQPQKVLSSVSLLIGEEQSFYWRLTGQENLEFFAALYGFSSRKSRLIIEEIAALFNLNYLDQRFQEYSTGMKHRLALARTLLIDAPLLFLDEPTKSLDPETAVNLLEWLKRESREKGRTVFFTTHRPEEAKKLADKVGNIEQGRLLSGCER